jgi:hypothetical protein
MMARDTAIVRDTGGDTAHQPPPPIDVEAASAAATAPGSSSSSSSSLLRQRLSAPAAKPAAASTSDTTAAPAAAKHPDNAGSCCLLPSSLRINTKRPDVVTHKTRPADWRLLQSRWRYLHSFFFAWGRPTHSMARIWPLTLFNMVIAAIICVDHMLRAGNFEIKGRVVKSFLPDISDNVIISLTPMINWMLFSTSLLLTLRVGRVYDRWLVFRTNFGEVGNSATNLSQRAAVWVKDERVAADIRRWAVAWHWSLYQVCTGAPDLDPEGAK